LGLICVPVLGIILTLGLWPFHAPANEVAWLAAPTHSPQPPTTAFRPGLTFGRFSTAFTSGAFQMPASGQESGASLEIWLQPRRIWDSSTLLSFCRPEARLQWSVRQSQTDLEIQTKGRNGSRPARLYVDNVFRKPRPIFITIAAGAEGTKVYVDGVLAKTAPRFSLSTENFTGQLVVGDSPGQTDSWTGQLFGLAIYHRELTPYQVLRHYEAWTQKGRPEITSGKTEDQRNVALYLLDERTGNIAHNQTGSGLDLHIPERYTVLDRVLLEPFWREFSLSWSYWSAALKNIVGFVPFGFVFFAWLSAIHLKRPVLATVLLGTLVSLTIEVLQAWLPTRDSGMTDLITNTLGTWIGVVSYRFLKEPLTRMLVWNPS
jgi:hypothetical protein